MSQFRFFDVEILKGNVNAFSVASSDAILTIIPFIGIIGFLSYRVSKHIRRLSRGHYVPLPDVDY